MILDVISGALDLQRFAAVKKAPFRLRWLFQNFAQQGCEI
jgi:hypothetical protein